uniref:Uncharacterized protein n=1 Tax=Rhodosorus marinus TaxID=101924 RepID=A0A7S3A0N9_9RHOD|mmetsp:Transcript_40228/g.159836  ORF Transcript_40228/g.159836 Transcript_40228/m.159836 type:complete len:302 (+) Transcript_40228:434-1339(+)
MAFVASGGVVSRRGVRAVNIRRNAGKADGEKVNVGKTPVQDGSSVGDGRDGPVDFNALRAKVEQRVKDEGVPLDVLMNPAKVLDLEARLELEADSLTEEEREKLKATLIKEKRMVMQDWLRNVFLVQGWGSAAIGGIMASGHVPFVPDVPLGARTYTLNTAGRKGGARLESPYPLPTPKILTYATCFATVSWNRCPRILAYLALHYSSASSEKTCEMGKIRAKLCVPWNHSRQCDYAVLHQRTVDALDHRYGNHGHLLWVFLQCILQGRRCDRLTKDQRRPQVSELKVTEHHETCLDYSCN